MALYHVLVTQEDGWFIGRVLERQGVTTQGRTLDELVFMLRDAIDLMWNERDASLELVLSGRVGASSKKDRSRSKRSSRAKRNAA
jgi:predicted RNase H-like HicB family nuclease